MKSSLLFTLISASILLLASSTTSVAYATQQSDSGESTDAFMALVVGNATTATTTTTTAAPTPTAAPVVTDESICAIGYLQGAGLQFTNGSVTYMMSVNPCTTSLIYPRQAANSADRPPACGVGFAGWTEQGTYTSNKCMHLYTKNFTTTNSHVTMYSNDTHFLTITWDCTGLEGDIDKTQARITAVGGTPFNRTVSIQTKGCIRPPDDKVKAGVIVAIVVVVVFVLAVIIAVVKAKCFGSGGGSINSFGSSAHNRKFEASPNAAVQQGAYQQMP